MPDCTANGTYDADKLTIAVAGRVDSNNAAEFGTQLADARSRNPDGTVTLDLTNLEYISSAGLRELLKLKKSEAGKPIALVGVSSEVKDVLEVTGFAALFEMAKATREKPGVREMSLDGLEHIRRDEASDFYRIDDETILKLYDKSYSYEMAENERRVAKAALVAGAPVLISFETVEADGRFGVLYEMVDATRVSDAAMADDSRTVELGRALGGVLRQINEAKPNKEGLQDAKAVLIAHAKALNMFFSQEDTDRIVALYQALPDAETLLHGSFMSNKVVIEGDEYLAYDMVEAGYGHPLIDLGSAYSMFVMSSRANANGAMRFGVSEPVSQVLWANMLKAYFGTDDEMEIAKRVLIIRAFGVARTACILSWLVTLPKEYVGAIVATTKGELDNLDFAARELMRYEW